ncbi:MAG: BON domain-containing protein [Chloroflexota bacterium]
MDDAELRAQVDAALAAYPVDNVITSVAGGVVQLAGTVPSEALRQEMLAAIRGLEGVRRIDDALGVETVSPGGAILEVHPQSSNEMAGQGSDITNTGLEYDFNDEVGTSDAMKSTSEAEPFFPPTDPVIAPAGAQDQGYEVVGGFASTASDDQPDGSNSVSGVARGDEEVADDIRRELLEDALTTDLDIRVEVRHGVVHLHGTVPNLIDAENAEAVAARVPGVVEVQEELTVSS